MGNSFGKIDNVTFSSTEQLFAAIYLDFTGFDQKCFIGRAMKVRRRNVAGGMKNRNTLKASPVCSEVTRTWASCPNARITGPLSIPGDLVSIFSFIVLHKTRGWHLTRKR